MKIRAYFDKHIFWASLSTFTVCFLLCFGVIFVCRSLFPDPGLRSLSYEKASLSLENRTTFLVDSSINEQWESEWIVIKDSLISFSADSSLRSEKLSINGNKFASIVGNNLEEGSFVIKGYQGEKLVEEGKSRYYGTYFGFQFSFNHLGIDSVMISCSLSRLTIENVIFAEVVS